MIRGKWSFLYLVIVIFQIGGPTDILAKLTKVYNFETYRICDDLKNPIIKMRDFHVVGKARAAEVSGVMEVLRAVDSPMHLQLSVNRCTLQKDDCKHYEHLSFDDICEKLQYSPMMHSYFNVFTPPLGCPLKVGTHVANKATINLQMFEMFPTENAFWQVEFRFLDNNNGTLACDYIEVGITETDQ